MNVFGQVTEEWVSRYNQSPNYGEHGNDMAIDENKNLYIVGSTKYMDDENWAIVKYNPAGNMVWDITYIGQYAQGEDEATSVAISNSGNCIYVTGYERPVNAGARNIVTKKILLNGTQVWTKKYKRNDDKPYKIAVSKFGNVFVAGCSGNSALLIKYNASGDSLFVKRYNFYGNNTTEFVDMEIDSLENVYCASRSGSDIIVTKFSSSGSVIWQDSYNGPGDGLDEAYATCLDIYGNFYAAGQSKGNGTDYDFLVISFSSSGAFRWESRISSPNSDDEAALDIQADNSGNVYATGYISSNSSGSDYLTVKYNSSGNIQWQKTFNGPHNKWDIAECVAVGPDNSVYVTGRSGAPPSPFNPDYYTLKYSSGGTLLWSESYNGSPEENGEDIPSALLVDNFSNVYVTGWSVGPVNTDMCTIKYSQPNAIEPISTEIPSSFSVSQNYPNPFNPSTKIRFEIPKSSFTTLLVYDALGRKSASIVNEELKPGTYEVQWDASSYPSGVYFYKLITPGYTETKKMLLVK